MNIGLIAMSGIRVLDAELLRLGLTLPGFVERSRAIASLPSLGLITLAGMTPSTHRVEYLEIPDLAALDELPDRFDLVAISSYSAQIDEAYALADRYRALGTLTVMGGPHVTAMPGEAALHCDAVVRGEGESSWPSVLEDAQRGCLRAQYGAEAEPFDLARSPMPAFELLDVAKYNRLTVQTSRGCPHRCEFCASSVLLTDRYAQKPAARVLAEIDRILSIWDHPFLEFADDNSFVDRAYWKELLPSLQGRGIRWFTETDVSVAEDEELLVLMREAGCSQILVGFESPDPDDLVGMELRNDWKHKRHPRYAKAIRTIQNHGITVNGCFVLGLDNQTDEIFRRIPQFVRETGLYEVQVTILTPFPGTPLYSRLEREERLIEPTNWKTCTLFDVNFRPASMSVEALRAHFKELVADLYSDEFTSLRRENFKRMMSERHHSGRMLA